MPTNEQRALQLTFYDYFLRGNVDTARLGIGISYEMRYFLESAQGELQAQLLSGTPIKNDKDIYERITIGNKTIDVAFGQMSSHLNDSFLSLAAIESIIVKSPFEALAIKIGNVGLTQNQIKHLVNDSWIMGSPAETWWASQSATMKNKFAQQLRLGFAQGLSMKDIVDNIIGKFLGSEMAVVNPSTGRVSHVKDATGGIFSVARRDIDSLVRTGVQSIAESARMENFRQLGDTIKGVTWIATLDEHTTPICRARDHKSYTIDGVPIGHGVPFLGGPPAHWRCRSTLIPLLKTWQELGVTNEKILSILDAWEGRMQRASMDGPVPSTLTYQQWFELQTATRQKDILGPRRYDLWKKYGLTFEELVDLSGRPLTINQLKSRYLLD